MQSGWKSNHRLPYEHGHNQHYILYNSKSLDTTDIDPEYQNFTALNNSFYEGVKNTDKTTLDGLPPIIERTTAKAIAVPKDFGTSKLDVLEDE